MRFGIKTAPQHTTWSAMLDVWRAADDIDVFESAWNFDHFYPIFSDSDGPCMEAWTMLAAMANATRRILPEAARAAAPRTLFAPAAMARTAKGAQAPGSRPILRLRPR